MGYPFRVAQSARNQILKAATYDSLNRLTQTTVGTTDITKYTYDKVGNKLTEEKYDDTTLENTKTNAYNEFNQLTSTTMSVSGGTAQTIATYSYDDRGNQILAHKRDFGATTWYDTTYQYDRAGYMQKSVTEKPGGITETVGHYYNGMEQRIRKVVDQNTTKYVYTGTTVLFTADDNNDKITENILSPGGQIVASNRFDGIFNGNAFFFNQDIRNSTTAIINKDLEALKYYEYDEQGREEEKGNPNFINENTFTGAISEGGNIFYMNARFYDANTGRFLSQDSYTGNAYEPWSQHLYSYCGNNPVNMIDPTGHVPTRNRRMTDTGSYIKGIENQKISAMEQYGANYLANKDKSNDLFDSATSTSLISSQKALGSVPYGKKGTASGNSCGAVATHNALILSGMDSDFNDVYETFTDESLGLIAWGAGGTNPLAVDAYLRGTGQDVDFYAGSYSGDKALDNHAAAIVLYQWFSINSNGEPETNLHYMAYTKNQNGKYQTYNSGNVYDYYHDMIRGEDMVSILGTWGIGK